MALHPAQSSKLIFAPAGDKTNAQADQYTKGSLERSQLDPNPFTQFHTWFSHAQSNGVHQPETVCLSTASLPSGRVSSRYVYLKELDSRGFVIYSNFGTSAKSKNIASNPYASLAFWWHELERQVRVEGRVERLSREESQVYFDTRARGSRVGAWASRQSQIIPDRETLEGWVKEVEERFSAPVPGGGKLAGQAKEDVGEVGKEVEKEGGKEEGKIPVPEFWGGLRILPERIEFWQGRESRLHDRFQYVKGDGEGEGGEWRIERLSP